MNKTLSLLMALAFLATGSLSLAADNPTSPEDQAIMQRMQAYSTPSENHDVLKMLEGNWNVQVSHWMKPGDAPETSEGSSEAKMIMDGRFLEQNFNGTFMEKPFRGRGIYGYDNLRKKYQVIWLDNVGTGITMSSGKYDSSTKTLAEEGTMSCPITGSERWFRAVTKIIDNNNYTYETYMKDGGQEFLSMAIKYTRK